MANTVAAFIQAIGSQVGKAVFAISGSKAAADFAAAATVAVVEYAGQAAIAFAVSRLLSPNPKSADQASIPFRQPVPPRQSGFGRSRLSGPYMLFEEYDGDSYDVIAFHDGEIDAIETRFLHDDVVTVGSGTISGTGYSDVVTYSGSGDQYENAIRWNDNTGAATETAHAAITDCPTWGSSYRGDGVASIGLRCYATKSERFAGVYPYGLPQPSVVGRWQACFDPRVTAHDSSDRSTWDWSENPANELATFLISTDCGGLGLDYDRRLAPSIDYWKDAADVCDESVSLKAGGSHARYAAGGGFQHDNDPIEVIRNLLDSMDGWLAEAGDGSLILRAGKFETPTVTFTDDHIIDFSWTKYRPDEDAENEWVGKYPSPDHLYKEVDSDPWQDSSEITAQGAVRSVPVHLPWVPHHARVRRLLKRRAKRAAAGFGTVKLNLYGLQALNERFVNIQNSALTSMNDVDVEIIKFRMDLVNGTVELAIVEVDSTIDDWDAATEEGTAPTAAGATTVSLVSTPTIDSIDVLTYASSTVLQVNVTKPSQLYLNYYVRYRTTDGASSPTLGEWKTELITDPDTSGSTIPLLTSIVAPSLYEVQVAAISPGGTVTAYSASTQVDATGAAAPSTPTDLEAGTV